MKKKLLSAICLVLVMVTCFSMGAFAADSIEEIKAYLHYGITVKLDGEAQTMYDATGKRVYPIVYQGTTYLPIRAVSNMLGIDVEWDGANHTVLLGETNTAKDFINEFEPYSVAPYNSFKVYQTSDGKTETIAGKTYDHWIENYTNTGGYYDLGGRYTTLTFQSYCAFDTTIYFYGDNEELLGSYEINAHDLPKEHSVDVEGVTQLLIRGTNFGSISGVGRVYIINAKIK